MWAGIKAHNINISMMMKKKNTKPWTKELGVNAFIIRKENNFVVFRKTKKTKIPLTGGH